jgi:acyl homoserine lactone synthase
MAITLVNWENAHKHGETWISHHRLRHRIFVERHRWDLPTHNGLEFDEFDTPAAQYVICHNWAGEAQGAVRLLPTTRAYMLQAIWPELLDKHPASPTVWEATRFGCDCELPARLRRQVVAELIAGCLEFGLANNVESFLALMPVSIFHRVIAAAGCKVEIGTRGFSMGGHNVCAASIKIDEESLAEVRRRSGLTAPLLAIPPNAGSGGWRSIAA